MLKCGIEIHQRIDSLKLFCNCKSEVKETEPDFTITRRLHPVRSEMGEIDLAARFEYMKKKEYCYQAYEDVTCLVEADEEPPHPINKDALEVALQVSLMLKCTPVDELHMMRKTVLDGSNTSGFQRTGLLATDGSMETSEGPVGIQSICIEEESSGIVEQSAGKAVYRLDRLGIPLVEIATAPDIKSPAHAKETAEKIGAILRATGRVQRGIGTIRQDINVSIPEGARVEIKGAQQLENIPKIVENEVKRQVALVEMKKALLKKNKQKKLPPLKKKDVSKELAKTESKLVQRVFSKGGVALAACIPGFAGLLGTELYENRRLGSELSDYAKAAAGVGGLIHSDEDYKKYKFSEDEFAGIAKAVGAGKGDAFILVLDKKQKAEAAVNAAYSRASDCFGEMRQEVRKVLGDGVSTAYMRPMPGAARMYPETDTAPVRLSEKLVKEISSRLPEMPEEKRAGLEKMLNKDLADKMMGSKRIILFERITKETKTDPVLVATTLEDTLVSLRREGFAADSLSDESLFALFKTYSEGLFVKAAIPEVLKCMASEGKKPVECVEKLGLKKVSGKELEKKVKEELAKVDNPRKAVGVVMGKFRLIAEPSEVMKIVKEG